MGLSSVLAFVAYFNVSQSAIQMYLYSESTHRMCVLKKSLNTVHETPLQQEEHHYTVFRFYLGNSCLGDRVNRIRTVVRVSNKKVQKYGALLK